jgi:hypothetical protein
VTTTCTSCKQPTTTAKGGVCLNCRIQDILGENTTTTQHSEPGIRSTTSSARRADDFERIEFKWDWEKSVYSTLDLTSFEKKHAKRCEETAGPVHLGRWEELTVDDVKFLIACGIEID